MPRDSSGNYTLPAGNPVVTGTTIASSWANATFNDLAAEMTDSLDRSGKGSMLSVLKITDGSLAAPGLAFGSEPGSGFYRIGASDIALSLTGNKIVEYTLTAVKFSTGVDVQLNGVSVTNTAILTAGTIALARLGTGTPSTSNFLRGDNSWAQVSFANLTGSIANGQVPVGAVSQWASSIKCQNIGGLSSTSVTLAVDPNTTPSGSPGDMFLYY